MKRKLLVGILCAGFLVVGGCTGTESRLGYIGVEKAKEVALAAAGLTVAEAASITADLEDHDGQSYYEVDFNADNQEYEYEIDALTGVVIASNVPEDASQKNESASGDGSQTTVEAVDGGSQSVRASGADTSGTNGTDSGTTDAGSDGTTDAGAGSADSGAMDAGAGSTGGADSGVTDAGADSGATDAGVGNTGSADSGVTDAGAGSTGSSAADAGTGGTGSGTGGADSGTDGAGSGTNGTGSGAGNGTSDTGNGGASGTGSGGADSGSSVTDSSAQNSASQTTNVITEEEAKNLVLAQVPGASAGNIVEFETDYDDGRMEYEGKLIYNGMEYEFEIDAYSGAFRDWDAELLDDDDD